MQLKCNWKKHTTEGTVKFSFGPDTQSAWSSCWPCIDSPPDQNNNDEDDDNDVFFDDHDDNDDDSDHNADDNGADEDVDDNKDLIDEPAAIVGEAKLIEFPRPAHFF